MPEATEVREPRAESREPRAESREPRAELRPRPGRLCPLPGRGADPVGRAGSAGRERQSRRLTPRLRHPAGAASSPGFLARIPRAAARLRLAFAALLLAPVLPGAAVAQAAEPAITLAFEFGTEIEVREGAGSLALRLVAETTEDRAPEEDFEVTVRTRRDRVTATAGTDYTEFSGPYVFPAAGFAREGGRYVQTVSMDLGILDDEIGEQVEYTELLFDTDTLPSHVTPPSSLLTVVINDDEPWPVMSVADVQAEEGEDLVFTLVADLPRAYRYSVIYTLGNDTATEVEDFGHPSPSHVVFDEGQTKKTVTVPTLEDDLAEGDETFEFHILGADAYEITLEVANPVAIGTILDDDHAPEIETERLTGRVGETAVGGLSARDADHDRLTLRWRLAGGADAARFTLTEEGALSFAAPPVLEPAGDADGDGVYELTVEVSDGSNPVRGALAVALEAVLAPSAPARLTTASGDGEATLYWEAPEDDGGSPVLGYEYRIWEVDRHAWHAIPGGASARSHTVTGLTNGRWYSVHLRAVNAAGGWRCDGSGGVEFPPHEGCARKGVTPVADAPGAPVGVRAEVVATAWRASGREVEVSWGAPENRSAHPLVWYWVEADHDGRGWTYDPSQEVSGPRGYRTYSGGGGYLTRFADAGTRSVMFPDTASEWSFRVAALYARAPSADNPERAVRGPFSEVVRVAGPSLSVSDASATEGTDTALAFTVTLDRASSGTVSVDYATVDGTATAGADYTQASGTLVFAPGETRKTVEVPILDDTVEDDGETLSLVLSNPSGAVLRDAEATGTIMNTEEPSAGTPLTARFTGVPESHDGTSAFTFELTFSENFPIGYATLRDSAFEVSGGAVTGARRLDRPSNLRWEITVEPGTRGTLTIALPERACTETGAVCAADGRALAARVEAVVPGPDSAPAVPAVSIAASASPVTEGADAAFTLSRTGDASAALTVAVEVTESGAMLAGDAPVEAAFAAGSATAELTVATDDDEAAEAASAVTAAVAAGAGYTVDADAGSAAVTVEDDDAAPVIATPAALDAPENATAVATLEATDADTAPEGLAWSLAGGADADAFTLSAEGVLAFGAAKDYESPDDADGDGAYAVTVRVTDGANPVEAALAVHLVDVDDTAPALAAAAVDGATLTLTFDEALDGSSVPGADAFAVAVEDAARTVDAVTLSGSAVTLTLATAAAHGETVTVGYVPPAGAGALQDGAGNAVAGLSDRAVENTTPAPSNTAPTGLPIIAGTVQVGETLTASAEGIEDLDGLADAAFAWQWVSNDGTADTDIEDATEAAYTPVAADAGRTLKVRVTFTDDGGTQESLVSAATAAVAAAPAEVSIAAAASPVTEGSDAVFVLRRTGDASAALAVAVGVSQAGAVLAGAAPSEASFAAGASETRLAVATQDDAAGEADGRVTVSVSSGAGYRVAAGAGTAGVDVFDDDRAAAPATVTTVWSADMAVVDYGNGSIGGFSADDFSNTAGSAGLEAQWLWYYAPKRKLHLSFANAGVPGGGKLTLHLGDVALALRENSAGELAFRWHDVDLDWTGGETVAVRLTQESAAQAPASGAAVSVADAQVREAAGAVLAFRVRLAQAQDSAVSVRYATANGTATAGTDYVTASGAVRFAPGATERTVAVAVLDDGYDEGSETMTLKLSAPFGAEVSDGQATGTIVNTDPVPKAWLARFGRTVAGQVVDAIGARLTGEAGAGSHVTLAGAAARARRQRRGGHAGPA